MTLIHRRVEAARRGELPAVVGRLVSGWAVMGDWQARLTWALLLPDPVVPTLNDLDEAGRTAFLSDMAALGDAVRAATGCARCNYGIYGNLEPALHAHVFARFADEPPEHRHLPPMSLPESVRHGTPFDPTVHAPLTHAIRHHLQAAGRLRQEPAENPSEASEGFCDAGTSVPDIRD